MSDKQLQKSSNELLEKHKRIMNLEGLVSNRNRELAAERERSRKLIALIQNATKSWGDYSPPAESLAGKTLADMKHVIAEYEASP